VRWASLLLTLAGCDLIFKINVEPDGSPGATADMFDPCKLPVGFDETLTEGAWFSADRAVGRAVKVRSQVVLEAVGDVDTNQDAAFTAIAFPNAASYNQFDAPRLAPGANELFLFAVGAQTGLDTFLHAQRRGEQWDMLVELSLLGADVQVTSGASVGPPTITNPRRMMLSQGNGVVELEQVATDTWQERHLYTAQALNMIFIEQAMLTPDGLELLLIAQDSAGAPLQVWIGKRASQLDTFDSLMAVYSHGISTPEFPFFTQDCLKHLYYSLGPQIHHVIL
jgi:hypothetical protein